MKTIRFNGKEEFEIPENMTDHSVSEEQLRQQLKVPNDEILYITEEGKSKKVNGTIALRDGMNVSSLSAFEIA